MRIELVNSREELLKHGRITGAGLQNTTLKKKVIDAFDNITDDKSKNLRESVWGSPHTSVFEFIDLTFLVEDVSLVVELFLIQFRFASYNIKSRRYVDFSEQGFHVPELKFNKNLSPEETNNVYTLVNSEIKKRFEDYNKLINSGETREDARHILPLCLNSNIIFKMNIIELVKMIKAGYESKIKEIADFCLTIRNMCNEVFGEMMEDLIFNGFVESGADLDLEGIKIYPTDPISELTQSFRGMNVLS